MVLAILDKHAKTLAKQIRSGVIGIDNLPPLARAKYDAAVDIAVFGVNSNNNTAGYYNKRRQNHEQPHIDETYTRLVKALNSSDTISAIKLNPSNVSKTLRAMVNPHF